ncbi:MAG TPA: glycosyltransferase N-terminal domain-containing protein [Chthoniobacteraceae bacterium]
MSASSHLPAKAQRSLFIYNLFFPIFFLALLPSYLLRMLRRGGYRDKFRQRFGLFSPEERARFRPSRPIWLHSISVGETFLALKLAAELRALQPHRSVVLSVTTSSGLAVAQGAAADWLTVIYNPLDSRSTVRRSLAAVNPELLIFIEAIWPNLLAQARAQSIPTAFVPRLSPRSERRFRRFARFTGPIFGLLDRVALADPDDLARWQALGVLPEKMLVTGNAKFDQLAGAPQRLEEFRLLLSKSGISPEAPVLLGGSTFPGEERILVETLLQLRADFPQLALILVPRHVERTPEIIQSLVDFRIEVIRRSEITSATSSSELSSKRPVVFLVDSTGELRDWYHLAAVVFIGKSLTASGGQNPVEPVLAGKPVIFGPHMENFEPLASRWVAADAAVRIAEASALPAAVAALLRDPIQRDAIAGRARQLASAHQGATERTARYLLTASAGVAAVSNHVRAPGEPPDATSQPLVLPGDARETPCQSARGPSDSPALPERPYRPEA